MALRLEVDLHRQSSSPCVPAGRRADSTEPITSDMRFIEIEQTGSPIRRYSSQRATLVGLGLNRLGRVNWVPDTPASRGMIEKVGHLVRINHDPSWPKPSPPKPVPLSEVMGQPSMCRRNARHFRGSGILLNKCST